MSTVTAPLPLVFGDYALEDRYRLDKGRVYLTGIQALVRLPMMQRQRDLAAGLNTGGFISGYRGSPLGMSTRRCGGRSASSRNTTSTSSPASTRTSRRQRCGARQQVKLFPGAKFDGVFAIWYGKGPGVDRSMDVLKHGNAAGTSQHGGVLALAGDDHGCQSSTLPHQSEQVFCRRDDPGAQSGRRCRNISISASRAWRCRATPAAGSASRRSPRRSRAPPRCGSIRSASRS